MDWGQGVSQRVEMMRSSGGLYREIGPLLAILELQRAGTEPWHTQHRLNTIHSLSRIMFYRFKLRYIMPVCYLAIASSTLAYVNSCPESCHQTLTVL